MATPLAAAARRVLGTREKLAEWRYCEVFAQRECDISEKIHDKTELYEARYARELRELAAVLRHVADTVSDGCVLSFSRRVYTCAHACEYKICEIDVISADCIQVKIGAPVDSDQLACCVVSPTRIQI